MHLRCQWRRCQHGGMTATNRDHLRLATPADGPRLLSLWAILFDEDDTAVRLANVITLPEYRGHGHGTSLVVDVVNWARAIDSDRVDLSAQLQRDSTSTRGSVSR